MVSGSDTGMEASAVSNETESKKRKKRKKKKKSDDKDDPSKTGEDLEPEKTDSVKQECIDSLKTEIGDLTKFNSEPACPLKTNNDDLTRTDTMKVVPDGPLKTNNDDLTRTDTMKVVPDGPLKTNNDDLTRTDTMKVEPDGPLKTNSDDLTRTEANDTVKVETGDPVIDDAGRTSDPVKDCCSDPVGEAGGDVKSEAIDSSVMAVNGENVKGDADDVVKEVNVKKHETSSLMDSSESKTVLSELKQTLDEPNSDVQAKHTSDSAIGNKVEIVHDDAGCLTKDTSKSKYSPKVATKHKDNALPGEQRDHASQVDEPAAQDKARPVEGGGGGGEGEESTPRKKLHVCALCGQEEVTAKTFKRCQK